MTNKIINSLQEINPHGNWLDKNSSTINDGRDNKGVVGHSGRQYQLITKERLLNCMERTGRGLLGILAVIFSLGIALLIKPVVKLFTEKKHTQLQPLTSFQIQQKRTEQILADFKGDIKGFDIRGNKWLDNEHLYRYFKYLELSHPQLFVPAGSLITIANLDEAIFQIGSLKKRNNPADIAANAEKTIVAFPVLVSGNHWILVFIDCKARLVECYDSKMNYGQYVDVVQRLESLAKEITKRDPGAPYKVISKISKSLQEDGFECGPWTLYFLEKRLTELNVDFNKLNAKQSKIMIAEFRLKVLEKILLSAGTFASSDPLLGLKFN